MRRSRLLVLAAYAVALVVAFGIGARVDVSHPLAVAFWADVAATVAVFGFSLALRNSSFYDPYWSVVPPVLGLYWAQRPELVGVNPIRLAVVTALVWLWAARLTWNWLRGWEGLGHEDWRYVDIRARTGALYWPASFLGIHFFPTLMVLLGCLPLYVSMAAGREPFGWLDFAAFAVTLGAILLEALADQQLRRFRLSKPAEGAFLRSGVWAWSRHPNYLGEMGFWWGLWLFALAANPGWWWTVVGPLTITAMFRLVSLPMIEQRMLSRRPAYAEHQGRSSLVLPWPRRSGA